MADGPGGEAATGRVGLYHLDVPSASYSSISEARWRALTFDEQIANLGTDVARAARAKVSGDERRLALWLGSVRALFDLTLADPRWVAERPEIERQRDLAEDFLAGPNRHGSTPESLDVLYLAAAVRVNAPKG